MSIEEEYEMIPKMTTQESPADFLNNILKEKKETQQKETQQKEYLVSIDGFSKNNKTGFSVKFEKHNSFDITKVLNKKHINIYAQYIGLLSAFLTIHQNYTRFLSNKIVIIIDNMIIIKSITKFGKKWMENGFIKADGTEVKNKEIIKQILVLKDELEKNSIQISFKYISKDLSKPNINNPQFDIWNMKNIVYSNVQEILN